MPYLEREGVQIFYETSGRGSALLLTHGIGGSGRMWQRQAEALQGQYQVIRWDIRGHGRSDRPAAPSNYSEAVTVADMAAILDACGAQRAVIGGLSLGGYMSLAFQLAHPERTRALVLCDCGPGTRHPERQEGSSAGDDAVEAFNDLGLDDVPGAMGEAPPRLMLTQVDDRVLRSLDQIKVPTLVVVGARDTAYLAATQYIAAKIPGAKRLVLDNAGHASNIDQPAAFNAVVSEFLSSLPSI